MVASGGFDECFFEWLVVVLVVLGGLGRWMTAADGLGLQWVGFCNGRWWLVVANLYLQCLGHDTCQTLAHVFQ